MQALIQDLEDFLAGRVEGNYSARLVTFLAQEGLIDRREAEDILAPGRNPALRPQHEDRRTNRRIFATQAALFIVILACGGVLRLTYSEPAIEQQPEPQQAVETSLTDAGFLRVIARPWAHVYVNGHKVATTPVARRFPLPPGRHFVRLQNPYFESQEQEVVIQTDETVTLRVELERAQPEKAP